MSFDSISCMNGLCSICDLGNNCNTQILANCLWKSYMYSRWQEKINSHHVTVAVLF